MQVVSLPVALTLEAKNKSEWMCNVSCLWIFIYHKESI